MEERVEPVVRLRGVCKEFPGVVAVDGVDLDILPGEVHVVAGENGAGKSTLMKLLSQVERPTAGEIYISGERVEFHGPGHAQRLGVAMVYQEFALAPHLSVAENLFLGREPGRGGFVDRRAEKEEARGLLERVGLEVDPDRLVSTLTVAEQQRVEIAKALAIDAKVVIMDEPTATLAEKEIEELFGVIRDLTSQGRAVLYISHRLDEIFRIADRVTVMRDGKVVATLPVEELDEAKLVRLMVGREIGNLYPRPETQIGDVLLRVRGLSRGERLRDCSFEVRAGEILGFAGLVGAGRTELARAVFGADPVDSGEVELEGRRLRIRKPQDAIEAGIGYLTEDRKGEGLALQLGIDQNITLASLPARFGFIGLGRERSIAERRREQLNIRTPSVRRKVQVLSGGNQQKVVVARWLETRARVLFFDEPARGIDVGAKAEMFALIGELAREGRGIVLISSYLPELINMCDRILVMRDGSVAGVLEREDFSEEKIIALATGVKETV
ncbi:Galactose/methyl galactoside import ATP-binding protein MglA [Rubrobacter xylanophilus DSM 9941]|uniref:sugar ABC transporter ATP-binding protein n=1 Tax=Rubrobacter xylanophilus TaxID=49319 RepID=UPI001F37D226|nr:sugar ABC transporter ATP-binding protein [Rubrobacter xylanophilus]QYJ16040.1 Galactose/methyl galactoside import ATP-binding protein MglA [Rubrobacter xylanophilus DSM 9941]